MMFVYPTFLWALLAVSIPVIIHLFNFRRYKKVYFTNVRFLKELQHESKSKSRLKEILILLARCLAIACLVLAFCQPILTNNKRTAITGNNAVSIYIDNSFSMENVQKQGPLLSIAKLKAAEIIKAYGNADKFQVITNDFEGKHQRFYSREDIGNVIDEIKISPAVKPLDAVIKRQNEFLKSSGIQNLKTYAISDCQKTTFNIEALNPDTAVKTVLVPITANQVNNVYIDSCWFETPLQQKGFIQKLHAKIVNTGNSPVNAGSAKLFLNSQQLALASFSIDAESKKEIQFTFECKQSGFNFGSVKIDDYPVTFDDELFFAFNSKINIDVTLINGKNNKDNSFTTLFSNDSLFKLTSYNEQSIDFGSFKNSDVVVLNGLNEISSGLLSELNKFTSQGGTLIFTPSADGIIESYNLLLNGFKMPEIISIDTNTVKTDKVQTENKFYSGVFEKNEDRINLPVINKHFKMLAQSRSNFENILTLQNGDILLGFNRVNSGQVYCFSSPMDAKSGNFTKHALFVPTIYRICFTSLKSVQLSYQVNSNTIINIKNDNNLSEQPPHIREVNNKADIVPEIHVLNNNLSLYTRSQISSPGFYLVEKNKESLLPLAFNYSRTESNLGCYKAADLTRIIETKGFKSVSVVESSGNDISAQILEEAQGKKLWKLFIILALSFIAIEITLLRFLK